MLRKFTTNGTFIPQDAAGNDMCILFMKYGRCRFKTKCKKSHWIPPMPDYPYPSEVKPPLPKDDVTCKGITKRNIKDAVTDSQNDSQELSSESITGCRMESTDSGYKTTVSKLKNNSTWPRRFKHVFHDNFNELVAENHAGINRLFNEAGAYFDNVTRKLQVSQSPRNKIEKRHLKVLQRIHWKNTQSLKEKLSQFPPSYNLKFDRSKIDFTRLKPHVYVLIHECMCVDSETKPVKPSSFEYLIADTLLAYLVSEDITAQEAERKLQQWGARAVRARQCVKHLWHILAISSNSSSGCAGDVMKIEEEVIQGRRTSLDYACVCAFALKRLKLETTIMKNSDIPRKISASVKQGHEAKRVRKSKRNNPEHEFGGEENAKTSEEHVKKLPTRRQQRSQHAEIENAHAKTLLDHAGASKEHVEKVTKHAQKANEHAKNENVDTQGRIIEEKVSKKDCEELKVLCSNRIRKKRKRSRQFKNVPFHERKRIKTRCIGLLSNL